MQITDVITAPWAIVPEKLLEIQAVYAAHVSGEKIDIAAVEARLGRSLANDPQGYQIHSGVAVIPIAGVIGKKMNLMSQISGGASTQLIERDIKAALSDPNVNSILLHIDSPGGTVDGTQTLADVVRAAREQKPVLAFADGLMASAAYWIGSSASEIISSSDTTQIGSIGVVTSHRDISKAEESAGIKTTEISAGKYKRLASQYAPLSAEGADLLQSQVDQLYTIFVDAVAVNREVTPDQVLADMADGRVFLSREAMQRGMIDHIANFETTILNLSTGVWPMKTQTQAPSTPVADVQNNQPSAGGTMDIATLREKHPEIVAALMQEGASAERARIQGCEDAVLAGHESLVDGMKYDGKSTGADVALAIIGAEKKIRADHLHDFRANAPTPVPHAPVPVVETVPAADDKSKPLEERAKAQWDADANLRAEFGGQYESYFAYAKACESGSVRIHGQQGRS